MRDNNTLDRLLENETRRSFMTKSALTTVGVGAMASGAATAQEDQQNDTVAGREWTPFDDNQRLITVNASPVDEEEENAILENEDWWQEPETTGNQ